MNRKATFPLPAGDADPGLGLALQPDTMARLVQHHLDAGAQLLSLTPDYLRWKDRDGSLVGYRATVRCDGTELSTYVTARTAPAARLEAEADRLQQRADEAYAGLRAFALVPEAPLLLLAFPIDRMMHDLRRIVRASKVRNLVAAACPDFVPAGLRFSKSRSICRIVRYKPERRAVLRWDAGFVDANGHGAGSAPLWLRVHADEQAARSAAATTAAAAAGVACPRSLGVLHERLHCESHVDGTPWQPFADDSSVATVAAMLARLHAGPQPASLPTHHAIGELDLALRAADDIARLDGALGDTAHGLADRLSHLVPQASPVVLAHGDLHPGQVLCTAGGAALCDFDRACRAPAAHDLATMFAHALELDAAAAPRLFGALLRAYGRHRQTPLDVELRWWTACVLLRNASRSFRQLRTDWPRATARVLQLATNVLEDLAVEGPWR